ncbi:MAG: hypothetical protein UV57_C0004G0020 [Parcubacteria group bacterium GW2011_GWD2_43_10]|nr:MAG: hypothetical protein UV47_C0005G0006 [Parcubacteria group bacterium GW2011_GWA2_42_80]KKS78895.1 MAG: hypothetical protein UV52_C0023G0010 [Parcubacteria group bacterium GW2011_GWD1_42_9]KKS83923.1 MAG: hypothetical protein UV57_C0004G0020 [Parcubacteria group bacterium GW2011_GWD2_43_10]KKS93752.1 MAG: hypothetical protein UV69_C0004G0015 [Parcubacteria group bacterium GW2011_GWE2_43_12]KKT14330.1 MAG: hypothetical protein UV92_C0001G0011 [Parcubacteria group bacterium GW2011_GWA1_43_2
MDIPKDKNYPSNSVQCDDCGGLGCETCNDKGWLTPKSHPHGRKCRYEPCNKPLHPTQVAVYDSDSCALNDSGNESDE